jgi:hypothetical protein
MVIINFFLLFLSYSYHVKDYEGLIKYGNKKRDL